MSEPDPTGWASPSRCSQFNGVRWLHDHERLCLCGPRRTTEPDHRAGSSCIMGIKADGCILKLMSLYKSGRVWIDFRTAHSLPMRGVRRRLSVAFPSARSPSTPFSWRGRNSDLIILRWRWPSPSPEVVGVSPGACISMLETICCWLPIKQVIEFSEINYPLASFAAERGRGLSPWKQLSCLSSSMKFCFILVEDIPETSEHVTPSCLGS